MIQLGFVGKSCRPWMLQLERHWQPLPPISSRGSIRQGVVETARTTGTAAVKFVKRILNGFQTKIPKKNFQQAIVTGDSWGCSFSKAFQRRSRVSVLPALSH